MPDVHGAAQRGGPLPQPGPGRLDRLVGLREARGRRALRAAARPRPDRWRPGTRRTGRAARPRTGRTGCTVPGRPPCGGDGSGRAERRVDRVRRTQRPDRTAPAVGVGIGAAGPAGGDHAVAQPAQHPDTHRATPATDRPKLASMNGKSVRMSPVNTSCISTRLWNEADLGWQRTIRPSRQAPRRRAPRPAGPRPSRPPGLGRARTDAGRDRRAVRPDRRRPAGSGRTPGPPPPTGPAAGPARRRPWCAGAGGSGQRRVPVVAAGPAGRRRRTRTPSRSGRARRAGGPAPGSAARCRAAGPGTRRCPSARRRRR